MATPLGLESQRQHLESRMKAVLYLGCPAAERADTEKQLAVADLSVVWVDTIAHALTELQRRDMPVLEHRKRV